MAATYGQNRPVMRERLTIQTSTPAVLSVASLTRSSTTATATVSAPHGYASDDYVTVLGATPAGYDGTVKITVTGATTFTYAVNGTLTTPATGTITAVYVSDAQGGRRTVWRTLDTIWAEEVPLRAFERLQIQAIQSDVTRRFRARARVDLTPTMRALWPPSWPPGAPTHTLEINGIIGDEDGRVYMFLECSESPRV